MPAGTRRCRGSRTTVGSSPGTGYSAALRPGCELRYLAMLVFTLPSAATLIRNGTIPVACADTESVATALPPVPTLRTPHRATFNDVAMITGSFLPYPALISLPIHRRLLS